MKKWNGTCVPIDTQWRLQANQEENINFRAFRGLHGPSGRYMAPMGARVPMLSRSGQPNPSQRREKDFGKSQNLENLQRARQPETANSSLVAP